MKPIWMRRARAIMALGLTLPLFLAALLGCTASPEIASPSPVDKPTDNTSYASSDAHTTTVDVDDRPFRLYVPRRSSADPMSGLVLVLHGYSSSAEEALKLFGLPNLSDQRSLFVAAPEGREDSNGDRFWNASRACCNFDGSTVDDVGYLTRVLHTIVTNFPVDPTRIYVAGHSNGAFMAYRLACEIPTELTAVVSVAGAMDQVSDCAPRVPASVLQVHGALDDTILLKGGAIYGNPYTSALETVGVWRRLNGCNKVGKESNPVAGDDDVMATTWKGCRDRSAVALWRVPRAGHVFESTEAMQVGILDWMEGHHADR